MPDGLPVLLAWLERRDGRAEEPGVRSRELRHVRQRHAGADLLHGPRGLLHALVPGRTVRARVMGAVQVASAFVVVLSSHSSWPSPKPIFKPHRAVDSGLASAYFAFAIIFFGTFTMNFFVAMMAVKYRDGTIQFDRSAKLEAAVSSSNQPHTYSMVLRACLVRRRARPIWTYARLTPSHNHPGCRRRRWRLSTRRRWHLRRRWRSWTKRRRTTSKRSSTMKRRWTTGPNTSSWCVLNKWGGVTCLLVSHLVAFPRLPPLTPSDRPPPLQPCFRPIKCLHDHWLFEASLILAIILNGILLAVKYTPTICLPPAGCPTCECILQAGHMSQTALGER